MVSGVSWRVSGVSCRVSGVSRVSWRVRGVSGRVSRVIYWGGQCAYVLCLRAARLSRASVSSARRSLLFCFFVHDVFLACAMVLVVAFLSQIYSRLLIGTCILFRYGALLRNGACTFAQTNMHTRPLWALTRAAGRPVISLGDVWHVKHPDQVRRALGPTNADSSWKTALWVTRWQVPADTRGGLCETMPEHARWQPNQDKTS